MPEESSMVIHVAYAANETIAYKIKGAEEQMLFHNKYPIASIDDVNDEVAASGVFVDGIIETMEGFYEWQGDDVGYIKINLQKEKKLVS